MGSFEISEEIYDARREAGPKTTLVTLVSGDEPLLEATANIDPASKAATMAANILNAVLFKKRIIKTAP